MFVCVCVSLCVSVSLSVCLCVCLCVCVCVKQSRDKSRLVYFWGYTKSPSPLPLRILINIGKYVPNQYTKRINIIPRNWTLKGNVYLIIRPQVKKNSLVWIDTSYNSTIIYPFHASVSVFVLFRSCKRRRRNKTKTFEKSSFRSLSPSSQYGSRAGDNSINWIIKRLN